MPTTTKKVIIERIAAQTKLSRTVVKKTVQAFLDNLIDEIGAGNRIEFRDFGVFEIRERAPRVAQNPKTLERVEVAAKRTVKFKLGRLMKEALEDEKAARTAAAKAATKNDGARGATAKSPAARSTTTKNATARNAAARTRRVPVASGTE